MSLGTVDAVDQTLAEWTACQMLKYQEIVFTHKAIISKLNPKEVEESVERISQMLQITVPWDPSSPEDDVEFLADCDQLCSTPPESLIDRVTILYGAWTALNYILISMAPRLPRGTWKAAQKRYYQLAQQRLPFQLPGRAAPPHSHPTRPYGRLRPLTKIERESSYRNPEILLGKQFVLFPGTENEMAYKVVEYFRAKDGSLTYTVLFHDCDDFPMEEHEVATQLACSLTYAD